MSALEGMIVRVGDAYSVADIQRIRLESIAENRKRTRLALIYALYEAADAICKADPGERALCEPLWARAAETERELGL